MMLIDPVGRERVNFAFQDALNGNSTRMERHLEFGDKGYWWEVVIKPAYNTVGEISGVSYNGNDISEWVRQQAAAERHQQKLDEIAFVQSHELRRPVASIKGLLNLIDMGGILTQLAPFSTMQQQIDHLDDKIRLIVNQTTWNKKF